MDELTIAFKIESPPSWLPIGRTAENNWRTVEIDCSYWFNMNAGGEVVLMYKPSCGMSPYPLLTERDGDDIIWRPKSGELVEGVGRLQAFFEVGTDVIGSSDMISCEVDASLLGVEPGTGPGQTNLPWALDIIEQIAELSGHYPKIENGVLYVWDSTLNEWVEFEASGGGAVESVNGMTGAVTVKTPYYLTVTAENGTTYVDKTPAEIDALSVAGYDVHMRLPMTVGEYTAVGDMRYFATLGISAFYGIVWFGNAPLIATARVTEQKIVHYELTSVVKEADIIRIEAALTNKADMSDIPTEVLRYAAQTLTEAEKAQARQNIGAASIADLGTVFTLKGGVASVADLPQTGNRIGDVWYVESVSSGFIWLMSTANPGGYWEELGRTIDLSTYAEKTWVQNQGYQTAAQVQTAISSVRQLPAVTSTDNGKFLRVVSGAWAAQTVPAAESNSFGGGS